MAMVVKNNMSAVRTLNTLNQNSSALQKSLAKVSSGMKINSAQDDASGYAISERMRVQIRSLDQANQNTQNASSLMKTAEGAVSSTMEILKTLKEKAINAATDTNTDSDRQTIQKELDQFIDQIDDNALTTFNGKYLVDGSKSQYGDATYTKMTNQSLQEGTNGETLLTDLKNRNDESLEIKATDYVTASYVKNGETNTVKFKVGGNKLQDIFVALDGAISGDTPGTQGASGTGKVFAGTNIAMTDPEGNASTSAGGGGSTNVSGLSQGTLDKIASLAATDVDSIVAAIGNSDFTVADLEALQGKTAAEFQTAVDDATSALASAVGTNIGNTAITGGVASKLADIADATSGKDYFTVKANNAEATGDGSAAQKTSSGDTKTIDPANSLASDITAISKAIAYDAAQAAAGTTTAADAADAIAALTDNISVINDGSGVTGAAYKTATVGATTGIAATDDEAVALANASVEQTAYTNAAAVDLQAVKNALAADPGAAAAGHQAQQTEVVMADSYIGKNSAGEDVNTADGTEGLTISSAETEIKNQVSGLTISITDSEGNVKKSANAALDDFKTSIYAKNQSAANEMTFQVGAGANQAITVGLDDMRSEALGLKGSNGKKVSVATQDKANAAVAVFDNAIQKVLDQQATIGAVESRLEYTSQNLTTSSENVQAAESTIRDADMAKEMTTYTKNNVLLQAAQSMLAQANQNSSAVLSLLQ